MIIDWANFTPWHSLLGGILIGIATALLLLINGKIAGISGVLGGLLSLRSGDTQWRILFLLGMLLAPFIYRLFQQPLIINISTNWLTLIIAGLLVGFGTRYSGGCTSGHGICGISRLSIRSLVATLIFIFSGILTVYITRHIIGK